MERGKILDRAKEIINGERTQKYGEPEDCFGTIAKFWQVYLDEATVDNNGDIRSLNKKDAAIMQALMKISREIKGAGKEDSLVDACGYLALAADMSEYDKKE